MIAGRTRGHPVGHRACLAPMATNTSLTSATSPGDATRVASATPTPRRPPRPPRGERWPTAHDGSEREHEAHGVHGDEAGPARPMLKGPASRTGSRPGDGRRHQHGDTAEDNQPGLKTGAGPVEVLQRGASAAEEDEARHEQLFGHDGAERSRPSRACIHRRAAGGERRSQLREVAGVALSRPRPASPVSPPRTR